MLKLCWWSSSTPTDQEILISSKDFADVKIGDVLELYHPDDEWNRLLLQVKNLPEDFQQRDAVSIEQGIVNAFSLRLYKDIVVNKVDPQSVSLDLVELLFKDQYFGRSDMWRLCKTLVNTCVYLKKQVEFAEMRTSINELWARGENVTSGFITDDTRIVFRSPTAVVQIFIQMSAEMWDFDLHGDLYFEKAVNGFLTDLFDKWKDQNCVHDVTIVLFSRIFYEAQSIDDFPASVRECLQTDSRARIYEDFYRVIVQNERYEEWTPVLRQLRILFNEYQDLVLHFHEHSQQGLKMPKASLSVASQGNFLETLNMSLNLFENYYLDRNFDRTGKVSVVITPGPGVFEVDRQLANITKQRTIDCGVGSDLVCMGEQPLHAAPLFKFHSKSSHKSIEVGDDYNIPHWMNHSFYMSKNQIEDHMNSSFVPRIKPPPALLKELDEGPKLTKKNLLPSKDDSNDDNIPFVDYDEYDAQVFKLTLGTAPRTFSVRGTSSVGVFRNPALPKTFVEARQRVRPRTRHTSDEISSYMYDNKDSGKDISPAILIPAKGGSQDDMSYSFGWYPSHEKAASRHSYESSESDELIHQRPVVGSAGSPVGHSHSLHNYRPHRALINPFAPSRLQFKMTSNRRRWVHAFPVDQRGMAMQARHIHSVQPTENENDFPWSDKEAMQSTLRSPSLTITTTTSSKRQREFLSPNEQMDMESVDRHSQGGESMADSPVSKFENVVNSGARRNASDANSSYRYQHGLKLLINNKTKMFGSVKSGSEQEWSPDMNTGYDWRPLASDLQHTVGSRLTKSIFRGDIQSNTFTEGITVDWKSLTIPASLPVTTDYFPDRRSLHYDYVVAEYELLPEAVNAEIWASWSRYFMGHHLETKYGLGQLSFTDLTQAAKAEPAVSNFLLSAHSLLHRLPPDFISPTCEDKAVLVYRRPPLNTQEVFLELISQRLGQGFQLIIKKKLRQAVEQKTPAVSAQTSTAPFIIANKKATEEDYYMSIGRIYHKLTLSGQSIRVTCYRPRHPQPQLYYEYRYRHQAPDTCSYYVSWTNFSNKKLENYNWNHLDQYICTQGDWEYGLIDPLKYWRSRFFLLPLNNPATKKIIDKETTRCDIYEERTAVQLKELINGFIKFLETMNKIKRVTQRKSKTDAAAAAATTNPSTNSSGSGGESPRKLDNEGKQEKEDRLSAAHPGVKLAEALLDPVNGLYLIQNQAGLPMNTFISSEAVTWCKLNVAGVESTYQAVDLMQRLMDEQLVFHSSGNPNHKFISGFYLYYIPHKVISKSVQPGDATSHSTTHLNTPGANYNCLFQNEWCEVAVLPVESSEQDDNSVAESTKDGEAIPRAKFYVHEDLAHRKSDSIMVSEEDDWRIMTGQGKQSVGQQSDADLSDPYNIGGVRINEYYKATLLHKYTNVEVDPQKKSDRKEFAIARYHAYYSPKCAFEIQLQWMVSTGCILGDLVYAYARRASSCGFHLIPVPCDPFALPYTDNSDPLRDPIFVPLNMETFGPDLLQGCSDERRQEILYIIQDAIVKRFGFLPASVKVPDSAVMPEDVKNLNHQYVHCTVGMFLLIPESTPATANCSAQLTSTSSPQLVVETMGQVNRSFSDLHRLYISRQGRPESAVNEVGFLWSWNYMSSRRWRSGNTGDENFQDTMLADFRKFCSNKDNRLKEFWETFRSLLYLEIP